MTDTVIQELIGFLLVIIPLGAAVRIAYCIILISVNTDGEDASYKKRAKNALIFCICSECIMSIIYLVSNYF